MTADGISRPEPLKTDITEGYIDRFQPLNNVETPSVEAWMGVVRAAHGIWKSGAA